MPTTAAADSVHADLPAATPAVLPSIAGVDIARLLAHCDHQPALARRLLRGVARDYADGMAGWQAWADAGDWAALRHAAHTLQGLAGTLAADVLRSAALALEQAAAAGNAAAVAQHLPPTENALARLLTALHAVRSQIDDAPPAPPASVPLSAPLSAAPHPVPVPLPGRDNPDLGALAALLVDSDSRAIDWWQTHELALADVLDPVALRSLSRAIARFDFDAALALCQRARGAPVDGQASISESTD